MPSLPKAVRCVVAATLCTTLLVMSGCGGAQARKARHLERGHGYLAAGNYEKARVEFQNALQIAPMDPEARFETGVADEKLGKMREAAQLYQGTIDVSPEHLGARTNLGRLFVFSGMPERALEVIQPALAKHPDDAELLALRAAIYVQQKDMAAGQADGEKAVKIDPKNEDAVAALAGIYASTNNPDKARVLLEGAVQQIPNTVNLRLVLAQLYAQQHRLDDAERVLTELIRLRPEERANRIRLAQFYVSQSQLDAAERTLRNGIKAIPNDRVLKLSLIDFLATRRSPVVAEQELKAMIGADPKEPELKFALARFYETNKKPEAAEVIYQQVIDAERLDAAGLGARDRLAELRAQRGDYAGAQKLIAEVLATSPRDTDALLLRGNIALVQKDPKSAIADLRAVLRDQPNAVPVMQALARAHLENGESAIAEETMRQAAEANPNNMGAQLDLAQLLAQLGKPEQAKPILERIVKEQPGNVKALDTLFRVSAETKDLTTAKAAADGIVATQPKSAVGYYYQGMLSEQDKHFDDALRLYGQAVDLQPRAAEPLEAEIKLLVVQKRVPEALKRLDELTAGLGDASLAPKMKGDLLASQGRYGEAQDAYKLAIARTPKWVSPYHGLAESQFAAKDPEGALATLRAAQRIVDQPEQLIVDTATYYESVHRPDEAMASYEEAMRANPNSEVVANNLAMLLVTYKTDSASLDRAKALTARFADSTNPSFLDTYGWVLFKRGEAAASVPVLERVVAKAPGAPVALYHLGMAESQAGKSAQARQDLERAVQSGANFSGIDEARATLEKLAKLPSKEAPKT